MQTRLLVLVTRPFLSGLLTGLRTTHTPPQPKHTDTAHSAMTDGDERERERPYHRRWRRGGDAAPPPLGPRSRIPAPAVQSGGSPGRSASAALSTASHGSPGSARPTCCLRGAFLQVLGFGFCNFWISYAITVAESRDAPRALCNTSA